MSRLEKIGKYICYYPGDDPTSVGVTALAPDVEKWTWNGPREGVQDDVFDVALYSNNDDYLAFEANPESDPVWVESRGELERLLHYANLGIEAEANAKSLKEEFVRLARETFASEPETVEPVMVVTRHPDFSDEISSHGMDEHKLVYIDLGSSFDCTPNDAEEAQEWAEGVWAELEDLGKTHPARAEVLGIISTTVERYWTVEVEEDGKLGFQEVSS